MFYGKRASPEGDEWSRTPGALLVRRLGVRVRELQPSVTLAIDSGRMTSKPPLTQQGKVCPPGVN